ncbi:MAG TPA: DNA translocase FtsK [Chloroflexota bacterium]|nr:DNA translocase FtsK [Chloroflexota bacterium]
MKLMGWAKRHGDDAEADELEPLDFEREPTDGEPAERVELGLIAAFALPVLAILLALVTYLPGGAVGRDSRQLLGYLFGWASYFLPVVVGALAIIAVRARLQAAFKVSRREIGGWLVEFLTLAVLLAAIDGEKSPIPWGTTLGGGWLGWQVWSFVDGAFGEASGIILILLAASLGVILLLRLTVQELLTGGRLALALLKRQFRALIGRPDSTRANNGPRSPLPPRGRIIPAAEFLANDEPKAAAETAIVPVDVGDGPREWTLPSITALKAGGTGELSEDELRHKIQVIEETLADFDVYAKVVQVNPGPTITQFGLEPGFRERRDRNGTISRREKIKVSEIVSLQNDLALALAAPSLRIEAPVPGRQVVGLEVPNTQTVVVSLRQVVESNAFAKLRGKTKLAVALGEDVSGQPVAADLAKMPHLLIAGATGSGKSVCINAIISCLLLQSTPDEVRLILVDPKRVELTGYNDIPHLLRPVVVDVDKVVSVLKWVVKEMDDRYKQFEKLGVRNIEGFNKLAEREGGPAALPYIVVIIDELADLMMLAPDDTERLICRLAQLARATGIHLVVATQRPSVDVITGLIKANFPTRISFAVTSQVDSRTILDMPGAEKLLGRGDMLFMPTDAAKPVRLQGVWVSEEEIEALVGHWRSFGPVDYEDSLMGPPEGSDADDAEDDLYEKAVEIAREHTRVSTSLMQRRLRVGYTRAARLIDLLEQNGVVGPSESGGRSREVFHGEE